MVQPTKSSGAYDLVIVGASFAGLVAARTAAMRGLRVAVLEAKPDAGARVHTTGILVKEAAEEIDIPHHLTRRVHGVRLYAPNHTSSDFFAPGYFFLTTRTGELLRWLAREAERAGAKIFYSARFRGAERDGGEVRLAKPMLRARYLIGADGARSRVAKDFGLGRNRRFLIGLEAEYDTLETVDPRFLHCFIDSKLAPGYLAWLAPGPDRTQVGLAVHDKARPDLARFMASTDHLFGYGDGHVRERRSGLIPCGGMVSPIAARDVLLIGDAAGMVSPLTWGGIRLAFHFARRAAQAVADHLQHMGPVPEVALARELPRFRAKGLMRRAIDLAPANPLLNTLFATGPMKALARHLYFHQRGVPGITFAEFERHLRRVEDWGAVPGAAMPREVREA